MLAARERLVQELLLVSTALRDLTLIIPLGSVRILSAAFLHPYDFQLQHTSSQAGEVLRSALRNERLLSPPFFLPKSPRWGSKKIRDVVP